MRKRLIATLLGAALLAGAGMIVVPPLTARPVYSVSQVLAGLTPRHNVWGGRTVWVRAVAMLGDDFGMQRDTVVLYDPALVVSDGIDQEPGVSGAFKVAVIEPNVTFVLLLWAAWVARRVPGLRWLYGARPGVYRVRFFQPTWCMSCAVGQLE